VNASGDGSGVTTVEQYTASALLRVSAEDGGIQCSDVGQYECIAGTRHQPGDIVNVTVSVAIEGKLKKFASKTLNNNINGLVEMSKM
jgi:hypothetical protein